MEAMTASKRRAQRLALKKRITANLNKRGPMNPLTLAACKRFNPRDPFVPGFVYYDDEHRGSSAMVPVDKDDSNRVGLYLAWNSAHLWGSGDYNGANADVRQMNFEIAAALTRMGFAVTVDHHTSTEPGRIVIWADENGAR